MVPATAILTGVCGAIGLAQLAVVGRWLLGAPQRSTPAAGTPPSVSVIVPILALVEGWEENLASLHEQEYLGRAELLLVADRGGPAWALLSAWAEGRPGVRLVPFADSSRGASDKNLRLIAGVRACARPEVLGFADADVRVGPGWLGSMVAPLSEPEVALTTAAMLYLPRAKGAGSALRMAWTAAGIPTFELTGCVSGQSLALRRRDYGFWGVEGIWSKTLVDDLSLRSAALAHGEVRFVAAAMPWSPEGVSLTDCAAQTARWMCGFRLYAPGVWMLGAAVTAVKVLALVWGLLLPARRWPLLAVLWGMDFLQIRLAFEGYPRLLPGPVAGCAYSPLSAALRAPLLQLLYLSDFLRSAFPRRVRWAGRTYRVRGPSRLEAEA